MIYKYIFYWLVLKKIARYLSYFAFRRMYRYPVHQKLLFFYLCTTCTKYRGTGGVHTSNAYRISLRARICRFQVFASHLHTTHTHNTDSLCMTSLLSNLIAQPCVYIAGGLGNHAYVICCFFFYNGSTVAKEHKLS